MPWFARHLTAVSSRRLPMLASTLMRERPVLSLVRMDPLRLRLQVAERDASAVRTGQPLRFLIEGDPTRHPAKVKRISPAITQEGRMVVVEAEVPYQAGLRPGSFARAEIIIKGQDAALAVPERTLTSFAGVDKVLVVDGGKVVERQSGIRPQAGRNGRNPLRAYAGSLVISAPRGISVGQPVSPES